MSERDLLIAKVAAELEKNAFVPGALGFIRGRIAKREGKDLTDNVVANSAIGAAANGAIAYGGIKLADKLLPMLGEGKLDPKTALILGALYAGAGGLEALIGTLAGHTFSTGPVVQTQKET